VFILTWTLPASRQEGPHNYDAKAPASLDQSDKV
jgi:hypothetical protein